MSRRSRDKRENPKVCYKCGQKGKMQFHHFYPKVGWYTVISGKYLCNECHKEVHAFMGWGTFRGDGLKTKAWYFHAFIKWMTGLGLIYLIFKGLI